MKTTMNESSTLTLNGEKPASQSDKLSHRIFQTIRGAFVGLLADMERSPGFYIWVSFLIALVFLAGYSLLMSLIFGMEIFEFSLKIPWEMMVSNYVFLVGSSVGLCLVVSLGSVFGLKRYELIGKRGLFLALIAIILGLSSIGMHLGHPERGAIYNALTPNLFSAMWYMSTLYPPYIACVAVWYWLLARRDLARTAAESEGLRAKIYSILALEGLKSYAYERIPIQRWESKLNRIIPLQKLGLSLEAENADLNWARVLGTLALISGLVTYTIEGSLFAHTEARPFWYGPLYPIDFFLGAGFCGFSWLMAMGILTHKLKRKQFSEEYGALLSEMAEILALLLSAGVLFTTYKMGHGLFEPSKVKTVMLFLNGPFSLNFWIFEIAIGLVLPVPILIYSARKRRATGIAIASIMVLAGYFVKRYDYVVASQVYPVIKEGLPSYFPAVMEIILISGIMAAFLLIYTLGARFLPLKEERPHRSPVI
jgi:molybdopterin-containing oxidoreductase family membrane subunit